MVTKTFTANVNTRIVTPKDFTADVILINRKTKTFTADIITKVFSDYSASNYDSDDYQTGSTTLTKTFTANIILVNKRTKTFTANCGTSLSCVSSI